MDFHSSRGVFGNWQTAVRTGRPAREYFFEWQGIKIAILAVDEKRAREALEVCLRVRGLSPQKLPFRLLK